MNANANAKTALLAIGLCLAAPAALAEVYSCGPGCYTSNPSRGAGRANLGNKIGSYTSVKPRPSTYAAPSVEGVAAAHSGSGSQSAVHRAAPAVAPASAQPVAAPMPAAVTVPRITPARAGGRRTILEQELANERNALSGAQKALAAGRSVKGSTNDAEHQARIRQLESAVLDRQQNIQALQRELGRM